MARTLLTRSTETSKVHIVPMERPWIDQFPLRDILVTNRMPRSLFSYVVRYDSGFAPNPFHGYCTLATCKPRIREHAQIGDWIVGTGSNAKGIRRGGHLVYAMKVTEILSTAEFWHDPRFEKKRPNLFHNWVMASGDNIYEPLGRGRWRQLNSYHSYEDGSRREEHVVRDTGVERILVSDDFLYFGGEGPQLLEPFLAADDLDIICLYRNYRRIQKESVIAAVESWIRSLGKIGFQGKPWDWVKRRAGALR